MAALVAVGVLARIVRYAARFPLWEAEAYAAATLLGRSFADLARPFEYQTVCPLGFLWTEGLAVRLLGPSEYALRIFPLVCGIAAVLIFAWVSGRILAGPARILSVGLLAVSYQPIRNSAECRQYASDLFFAIALIALCVGYLTARPDRRMGWWVSLAAVLPVALLFSLTAVFVAAGVIVAIGWSEARPQAPDSGEVRVGGRASLAARLAPAGGLAALLATSLAVLAVVHLWPVYRAARSVGALSLMWKDAFPPLSHPARLPLWLLETHTGRMFAYVTGGPNFRSSLTTLLFVLGCVETWRRNQTALLLLITTPFLAGFAAAALHLYPYGGNDRLVVYLGPAICLMAGRGAASLLERLPTTAARRNGLLIATLLLAAFGLAVAGESVVHPYKGIEEERGRRFATSFWAQMASGAEVASLKADLHIELEPEVWLWSDTGWRAAFYYYRAIYGPAAWRTDDPRWSRLTENRPLRAVAWTLRADRPPVSEAAWLASISGQYRLRRRRVFRVNEGSVYLVYELVPIVGGVATPLAPFPPGQAHSNGRAAAAAPNNSTRMSMLGGRLHASHHFSEIGVNGGPQSDLENKDEEEIFLNGVDNAVSTARAVNPEDRRVLVETAELLVTDRLGVLLEALQYRRNLYLLPAGKFC